ncbi:tyrosine phosphatase family-domain-containing protein [Biscogniauxia mediterranea]|nr:tyrosine phosphatase family-domain-containing protein [Biscogniauxia mediterranea]
MASRTNRNRSVEPELSEEMKDREALVNAHEHHQSLQMTYRTTSPEVVLQETYISAKDIAVERPIAIVRTPPKNFGVVIQGLYRSGYPETADYPFIETLKLKTIVTLVSKDLPDGYRQFVDSNRITHKVFNMTGTKKADIPIKLMQSIMAVVSNRKNYPLLIHCNQGKHRTGCVVGVLRKAHEWDTNSVIQEYTKFAAPKIRETDVKYLTDFRASSLLSSSTTLSMNARRYLLFVGVAFVALCGFMYTFHKLRCWPTSKPSFAS